MTWGCELEPYKLYVLFLENDKFYVGITRNVQNRYWEHKTGHGASWTRKNSPIFITYVKDTRLFYKKDAEKEENMLTLKMMKQYGVENVRGGDYCQIRIGTIKKSLRGKLNKFDREYGKSVCNKINKFISGYKNGKVTVNKNTGIPKISKYKSQQSSKGDGSSEKIVIL